MGDHNPDRRKEPRFVVGVEANVRHSNGGDSHVAVTMNVSSSGVLLRIPQPHPFKVGDEVVCDLVLPTTAGQALSTWGIGHVVRVDNENAALELQAGLFSSPADET